MIAGAIAPPTKRTVSAIATRFINFFLLYIFIPPLIDYLFLSVKNKSLDQVNRIPY